MKRRTFLKIAGVGSLSLATGCSMDPPNKLYSLVNAPDDMITGAATWYASTCRECPAGCGILAKNREGRIIKLEGNPYHPVNQGSLCMRGQAALQGIFNPDRIRTPLLRENERWKPISFTQAETLLRLKVSGARGNGKNSIRMITETVGDPLLALFSQWLKRKDCGPPLVYEAFAYESLKAANAAVYGIEGLPIYRLDRSDTLVSFGADFMETWLSPVAYARQFKQMHRIDHGKKGRFFCVSPHQSVTAANADQWLACRPGAEAHVAMGLLGTVMAAGKGRHLNEETKQFIRTATAPFSVGFVSRVSDIAEDELNRLGKRLLEAKKPLVLGTGNGIAGPNAAATDMAAHLLNIVLNPELPGIDFSTGYQVETAARRRDVLQSIDALQGPEANLLLINNTNPVYSLPPGSGIRRALRQKQLYVVSFSNFMDDTAAMADLIFPVGLPLENWDVYSGQSDVWGTLQPAMGRLSKAPNIGDVILRTGQTQSPNNHNYDTFLYQYLKKSGKIADRRQWLDIVRQGGMFEPKATGSGYRQGPINIQAVQESFSAVITPQPDQLVFTAVPSIRFFDGRGANKPWLCEIPDPVTKVAWQTPVLVHPETAEKQGWRHKSNIAIQRGATVIQAPVYTTRGVSKGTLAMGIGQGHQSFGRYASTKGANPAALLPHQSSADAAGPLWQATDISTILLGGSAMLANTDGSRSQHHRKIALSISIEDLAHGESHHGKHGEGLTMETFPLTLPLPEGYDPHRDIYPPHDHDRYRWGMVIDLDRCIGCGACAAACYAENNLGVVGEKRIVEGREMSWMRIERYYDSQWGLSPVFLPMLCQHCDSAPCESVCPVYAPHHSNQGLNNQIYNRCIGTRFCAQNCPYKVRRFNWFTWEWPRPMDLQLNPDVTVRTKGVMEKCSFCIQRIKAAHGVAKNEKRDIQDGEIRPACLQTCPTEAIAFGNLMDKTSRVRQLTADPRAYQVMGYLNTKPAVFYLKKVRQEL